MPRSRPRSAAASRPAGIAALLLLLGACASDDGFAPLEFEAAETRVEYEVEIEGAPDEAMQGLIESSIALLREQENGAQSLAFLRRRAQGDVSTVQTILRSQGYYEGAVETEIVPPAEDAEEPGPATARVIIRPGPRLTLVRHDFLVIDTGGDPPPPLEPMALGSPVGGPAVAAGIVAAEGAAVAKLRREGRPYAAFRTRDAVADLEADTLEIESVVAAGPRLVFGPTEISGAPNVDTAFIESYVPWSPGEPVDVDDLEAYQSRLFATGLFAGVIVRVPETPPEGPAAPIAVTLEEAPFRTVSLGLRFSTDDGPAARAGFAHRNIFGAGERLEIAVDASLDEQIADATLTKPQYLRDGQELSAGLELRRIEEDRFDELGATLTLGIRRELTERWSVGAGGLLEASLIDEGMGDEEAYLAGLPLFAAYDSTDDRLDATRGERLRLSVTPFAGVFEDEATQFLTIELRGAAFHDILGDTRFVLAGRGRLGATIAENITSVPATRRFYSGGGGSVRGYEEDFIGPLDDQNDPTGGLSVAEAGLELRAKLFGDLGGVVFTDAGVVSEGTALDFSDRVQVAAGVGLRYYSPVGPVRLDVGFPVNGRSVDDSFQAYFSIGQAF